MEDRLRQLWGLRRRKNLWRAVYLVISLVLLYRFAHAFAWRYGDGGEYVAIAEAWINHHSPDLRAADIPGWKRTLGASIAGCPTPYSGFAESRHHTFISRHFWLYPLLTVPAKLLLRLGGLHELAAFQTTNLLLFLLAIYLALFHSRLPLSWRVAFIGLAACSPVVSYLEWPHPEAFTWSFIVMSLVMAGDKRFAWAAFLAGVAATQNPPAALLALLFIGLAAFSGGLKPAALTAAASVVALAPNLYYYILFGHPSLIVAKGEAAFRFVSWERTWSFFTDLNQGMLPYVPFLLLVFVVAILASVIRRKFAPLTLLLAIIPMLVLAESTANWNSACAGMMRYAVWMVPLLAWVAAQGLIDRRWGRVLLVLAIVGQGTLTFRLSFWGDSSMYQTPLAWSVLDHHPGWYNPDFEIFAERQRHNETAYWDNLPVAHADPTWNVTKILTDAASLDRIGQRYLADPGYLRSIKAQYGHRTGLFYLEPPHGAVVLRRRHQAFTRS